MNDTTLAPVVRTVDVAVSVERAFDVFTERIGEWWPLEVHSLYVDKAATVVIEGRPGGRVYEVSVDGQEGSWGEVLEFDPPSRVVLAWKPNTDPRPHTRVEVTFTEIAGGTHVELTHTGWELLGDIAEEARTSYHEGWVPTLERYAKGTETL
jgi:uncharacterized protein YndB with AHSA1/START domain